MKVWGDIRQKSGLRRGRDKGVTVLNGRMPMSPKGTRWHVTSYIGKGETLYKKRISLQIGFSITPPPHQTPSLLLSHMHISDSFWPVNSIERTCSNIRIQMITRMVKMSLTGGCWTPLTWRMLQHRSQLSASIESYSWEMRVRYWLDYGAHAITTGCAGSYGRI